MHCILYTHSLDYRLGGVRDWNLTSCVTFLHHSHLCLSVSHFLPLSTSPCLFMAGVQVSKVKLPWSHTIPTNYYVLQCCSPPSWPIPFLLPCSVITKLFCFLEKLRDKGVCHLCLLFCVTLLFSPLYFAVFYSGLFCLPFLHSCLAFTSTPTCSWHFYYLAPVDCRTENHVMPTVWRKNTLLLQARVLGEPHTSESWHTQTWASHTVYMNTPHTDIYSSDFVDAH